jgi:hypothetical protein
MSIQRRLLTTFAAMVALLGAVIAGPVLSDTHPTDQAQAAFGTVCNIGSGYIWVANGTTWQAMSYGQCRYGDRFEGLNGSHVWWSPFSGGGGYCFGSGRHIVPSGGGNMYVSSCRPGS